MENVYLWGKILCEDTDYYIALGVNFKGRYEFPEKLFYYSQANFDFAPLPETFPYHDKDFIDTYYKALKGNPKLVLKKYKEDIPEGETNEPKQEEVLPEDTNQVNQKIQDPDASVDDNAPKKEEPKENYTELLKLSYLIRQIDYDTNVIPEGALCLIPEHELRINRSFKGLNPSDLKSFDKYLHFRPCSEKKKKLLEEDNSVFRYDILDSITEDTMKGSWTIQLDSTKTSCNLRSLLWPGYFAVHQSHTNLYCSIYIGNAIKNTDLPFLI